MPDDGVHIQPQADQPQQPVATQSMDVVTQSSPGSTVVQPVAHGPVEQVEESTEDVPTKVAKSPKVKHPSNKPIGIIIAAVIVCAGLIAGVIYLQLSRTKSSNTKITPQTINRVTETQANTINTQNGIDATISNADSLANQADDQQSDLSDQALGL